MLICYIKKETGKGMISINRQCDMLSQPQARINVNGTVKHRTKIDLGKYKGSYILGIESPEIIDSCTR